MVIHLTAFPPSMDGSRIFNPGVGVALGLGTSFGSIGSQLSTRELIWGRAIMGVPIRSHSRGEVGVSNPSQNGTNDVFQGLLVLHSERYMPLD